MIQSAAAYNPFNPAIQTPPPRAPERPVEPGRANPAERVSRPVGRVESAQKDNLESQRNLEQTSASRELAAAIPGEVLDAQTLDALVGDFLARADRDASDGRRQPPADTPQPGAEPPQSQPSTPGASLGFADLRSALDYWESLNPERIDPDTLPAPIAAYRQVESGPTPSLGLSAFA